jgi:hypothetical protein
VVGLLLSVTLALQFPPGAYLRALGVLVLGGLLYLGLRARRGTHQSV